MQAPEKSEKATKRVETILAKYKGLKDKINRKPVVNVDIKNSPPGAPAHTQEGNAQQ